MAKFQEDTEPGWVDVQKKRLPEGATVGGHDGDEKLYIARGMIQGIWIPGSFSPSENNVHVVWKNKAMKLKNSQVLVHCEPTFKPFTGDFPEDGLVAGEYENEIFFVGRGKYQDSLVLGCVSSVKKVCHVAFLGRKIELKDFEIFVHKSNVKSKLNILKSKKMKKDKRVVIEDPEDTEPGWVTAKRGGIPTGATAAGNIGSETVYIARGMVDGAWIPGTFIPSDNRVHIGGKNKAHKVKEYQVLVYCEATFKPMSGDDEIPEDAVVAGETFKGEEIYIGRVKYKSAVLVGAIYPTIVGCFFAFNGERIIYEKNFEILVHDFPERPPEPEEASKKKSKSKNVIEDPNDTEPGWIRAKKGALPTGATVGGYIGQEKLYIARAMIDGCWIPGSFSPKEKCVFVARKGKVKRVDDYQVLVYCEPLFQSMTDEIPENAIVGGETLKGEEIFIGRAKFNDALILGSIYPSQEGLFAVFDGELKIFSKNFEVMVHNFLPKEATTEEAEDSKKKKKKKKKKYIVLEDPNDKEPGWVGAKKGLLPSGSTVGGNLNGEQIYIARTMKDGAWIPGSYIPSTKQIHCAWKKKIFEKSEYQILVYCDPIFKPLSPDGEVPEEAIVGGQLHTDEELFVGRVNYEKSLIIGCVHPKKEVCYVNYMGDLIEFEKYEILVHAKK